MDSFPQSQPEQPTPIIPTPITSAPTTSIPVHPNQTAPDSVQQNQFTPNQIQLNHPTQAPQQHKVRSKLLIAVVNIIISIVGLTTGAVIVRGMVVQKCASAKNFVSGVFHDPGQPSDQQIQKCLNADDYFIAGVLPTSTVVASQIIQQPDAGGAILTPKTPDQSQNSAITVDHVMLQVPAPQAANQQTTPPPFLNPQTAAAPFTAGVIPRPATSATSSFAPPASSVRSAQPSTSAQTTPSPATESKPSATPAGKPNPANIKTPVTPAKPAAQNTPKPLNLDLDKLAHAVAMTETHDCQDTRGSALLNNCFGIKKNGHFMSFDTPEQSHDYFKQLWVKGYGGTFPTYRMAQVYSGSTDPTNWLKNVTYYYRHL